MKWNICGCKLGGLTRPRGPIQIKNTDVKSPDVLVAQLSGASKACVAVVKHKGEYYFVAPKKLGGTKQVPADSLTDCLNFTIGEMNYDLEHPKKKGD